MSENYPVPKLACLSVREWLFLGAALLITSFLALGAHDLAIAHLGIPFPDDHTVPQWGRYLSQIVRVGSIALACQLGRWFLDRRSPVVAATIMGIVMVLLQETLRVLIVNIVMVDGLIGDRWLFMLVNAVPDAVPSFYNGAVGLLIARYLLGHRGRSIVPAAAAVLCAAAVGLFVLQPAVYAGIDALERAMHLVEPPEVYQMPYGLYVYSFIYSTFIEPTLATFFLAYLLWPALPRRAGTRVAAFVLMVLLIRGRIVATGLFSLWVPQPTALAFAAEGQFFAETLVMALLAGLAWDWIARKHRPAVGCELSH